MGLLLGTGSAYPIQNGIFIIDEKAVVLPDVFRECLQLAAIQVEQPPAALAHHVGVQVAVVVVAADAVRVAFSIMLGSDPQFCVMLLPQAFVSDVLPWTAVVVWLQSVMMIASALWRRKTMVKGIALLVVVAVPAYLVTTSLQLSHSTINLLTTLLTVVNYVIVYKIFAKTQIR